MKKLISVSLLILFSFQLVACARKEKEAVAQTIAQPRKIAQKVAPLEPTFQPKGPVTLRQAAPITIPPIGG